MNQFLKYFTYDEWIRFKLFANFDNERKIIDEFIIFQ